MTDKPAPLTRAALPNAQHWADVEGLFQRLLDTPQPEHDTILAAAPPAIAAEARAMLAAFHAAESTSAAHSNPHPLPPSAGPGTRLGPWLIESEIAHGGMGTVFLASRDDDEFHQKAALKLIRPGFSSEEIVRRFRNERQILAALDHPNIARLLDGGSTDAGQPYLVMEFIDGRDLLEFAHAHNLSRQQRLRLFLKIAAAVAHAHRHLVIHRDLKPSNILVTAEGEPKLLDFGIAKLVDNTHDATATGLGFFSPLYASPEQLSGDPVSTSTDIYSLGVVLFELLCGHRPYRLQTTSNAELVAAILLHEPDAPRGEHRLPPDLESIVLKALRKKPAERYPSVEQLAADVGAFLANRPVSARKGNWSYQARKFIQRNKLTVIAASLAIAATGIGIASTLFQARRAERRFNEVRQLAQYLVFDFHDAIAKLPGSTQLQKDVVERSMQYLDRLSTEASGDSSLQLDLAEAYLKLGDVLGNPFTSNLGETEKAFEAYKKSMETVAGPAAANTGGDRAIRLAANARMQLGSTRHRAEVPADSYSLINEALRVHQRRLDQAPNDLARQIDYARALAALAVAQTQSGAYEGHQAGDTSNTLDKLIAHLDRSLVLHPGNAGLLRHKALAIYRLANVSGTSDPNRAVTLAKQAIDTLNLVTGPVTADLAFRSQHASMLLSLAWSEGQTRRYDDAVAHYGEAQSILQPIAVADSANVAARYRLTAVFRGRGLAYLYADRYPEARADFETGAKMLGELLQHEPSNTTYTAIRGELLNRVARIEQGLGNQSAARAAATQSIELLTRLASAPGSNWAHKVEACKTLYSTPVPDLRDPARALDFCRQAAAGKSPEYYVFEILGHAAYHAGRKQEAFDTMNRALELLPPDQPGKPPSFARSVIERSLAQMRAGTLTP